MRTRGMISAGEAAGRLGVSRKALRLYEAHGLLAPDRTRAGWRTYPPEQMARAAEIVALRRLGFGIAQIAELLDGSASGRDAALAQHQSRLAAEIRKFDAAIKAVTAARHAAVTGGSDGFSSKPRGNPPIAFDLPWPWAGERFELPQLQPLTYITGPLGSGKTRFAMRLAEALPEGQFLGLDRGDVHPLTMEPDRAFRVLYERALMSLRDDGATLSVALRALVAGLYSASGPLVVDMVEQGLDHATQSALAACLRRRERSAYPLFVMTRSSAILDLAIAESGETIIYCPANHSPPMIVDADPQSRGHAAVATCLAAPDVRARTAGVVVTWPTGNPPAAHDSRETMP